MRPITCRTSEASARTPAPVDARGRCADGAQRRTGAGTSRAQGTRRWRYGARRAGRPVPPQWCRRHEGAGAGPVPGASAQRGKISESLTHTGRCMSKPSLVASPIIDARSKGTTARHRDIHCSARRRPMPPVAEPCARFAARGTDQHSGDGQRCWRRRQPRQLVAPGPPAELPVLAWDTDDGLAVDVAEGAPLRAGGRHPFTPSAARGGPCPCGLRLRGPC
jgi:hypothetical protein